MADPTKLTEQQAESLAGVIRDLIKHENDLVNQRLGWLIQIQGLLFAALAFAWERAPVELTALLAVLGIATAVSLWSAISLYSPAVRGLRNWWAERVPESMRDVPYVIGYWSPSTGVGKLMRPWRALPVIFVVAWVGALAIALLAKWAG